MYENNPVAVKNATDNQGAEATRNGAFFTPRVDIIETDDRLLLFADMPGVSPYDIDLHYERGELILRGKVQPREPRGTLIFSEYDVGDYYRVFQVKESIDASRIEAEYKQGVLTVHLPKQEAIKPKQVPIKVSGA